MRFSGDKVESEAFLRRRSRPVLLETGNALEGFAKAIPAFFNLYICGAPEKYPLAGGDNCYAEISCKDFVRDKKNLENSS